MESGEKRKAPTDRNKKDNRFSSFDKHFMVALSPQQNHGWEPQKSPPRKPLLFRFNLSWISMGCGMFVSYSSTIVEKERWELIMESTTSKRVCAILLFVNSDN